MSEPVESIGGAAAEVEGVTAAVVTATETGAMGEIRQEAGQRRWGGPPSNWDGPPPPKRGAEVFVGKLPRDADEAELLPVLTGAGRLWELRLMVDFSGANRGFAFATYASKEEARSACASLNNAELRPGKHLGVVMSVDNCRLFVGGIPRERRREEILAEVSRLVDGVRDVIVYPSAADKSKNRGFAFVEFESHKGAAQARRKLGGGGGGGGGRVQLWGAPICVDWAEPEQEVDEGVMATVRVLYVRNLMLATTEEAIRAHFDALRPGTVERVKKLKDFAFVHYTSREAALANLAALNGSLLDSAVLEVQLSKPPDKTILRYVKSAQRSSASAAHGPHAAAGLSQEVLAAATHNFLQAAQQPSPLSLAAAAQLDPLAWAYAGAPLLQPPLLGPTPPDAAARAASLHRGAAGMRSAGFVAQVNKHVRNARSRRSAELVGGYEAAYPYPPLFPPPPPSPISPTATAAPGVVWLPAVQAQHLQALSLQPSLDLGAASLGAAALGTTGLGGGKATEVLSVYCRSAGLGEPSLEVEEVLLRDVAGASLTLYSAAVLLPALAALPGGATPLGKSANPFQSPEEAKECAAQLALIQLASAAATLAPQATTLLQTVSAPPPPPVPANLPPTPLLTPEAFPPLTPANH